MPVVIVGIMATGRSDLTSIHPKVVGLFTEKVNFDSMGKTDVYVQHTARRLKVIRCRLFMWYFSQ